MIAAASFARCRGPVLRGTREVVAAAGSLLTGYTVDCCRRYVNKTRLLRVYEEPSNVIHLQMQKKYGFK